ncbi:MAG: Mur ligase family protein [Firmicutes bacterium]|nr:Mur ligase family protein [Bacillota bacterium]
MGVLLGQLFDGIPCWGLTSAHRSLMVSDIANDSRRVKPGTLFVAVPGQHGHGLDYVRDAVKQGAVAVLAPWGSARARFIETRGLVWLEVEDPQAVLAELSARVYGHPARELSLIGITGTNGKTTTVYMLAHILAQTGHAVAFWSTNSVEGIPAPYRPSMTTPDPPRLHQFLREARNHGAHHAILEVSSHALALGRIAGLSLDTAAITNISPDHLDFHGSFDAYRQAKARILSYVKPGGTAFLNGDDPAVRELADGAPCSIRFFGVTSPADSRARRVILREQGSRWEWIAGDVPRGTVELPVPGQHNVMNALAALGMALTLGVHPEGAVDALRTFRPAARRLEIREVGSYTLVSDVAMNPASYDAVLATVGSWGRPLVIVHAVRGNRGTAVNAAIADVLARWDAQLHFAPVIATLSASYLRQLAEDYAVRPEESAAFMGRARELRLSVDLYEELPEALEAAVGRLETHGVLLLLGTFGLDEALAAAERTLRDRQGLG